MSDKPQTTHYGVDVDTAAYDLVVDLNSATRSVGNDTLGVLLTQAEAILPPGPQVEAYKSLIRNSIYSMMNEIQKWQQKTVAPTGEYEISKVAQN